MKILSFGAGMQSTALALMSCENVGNASIPYPAVPVYDAVIFCNLGLEPSWVDRQVELTRLACEKAAISFYILDTPLYQDFKGPCEISTCYGDICKIVNALRDYSTLLLKACEEWDLQGYHRAIYELQAEKLKKISMKFQAGIGYDYDKAVEKCRKKRGKGPRNDDVGGEAMMMAYLKARRTVETAKNQDTPVGKESEAAT